MNLKTKMNKWEVRKHYVKKASLATCDADMRFYLEHAGFIQCLNLEDVPELKEGEKLKELL